MKFVLFLAFLMIFSFVQDVSADPVDYLDETWAQRDDIDVIVQSLDWAREKLNEEEENPNFLWRKARIHYWLGEQKAQTRDEKLEHFERGLELTEKAAELNPEDADIFYWKGTLIGLRGQTRGVLQSLFMVDSMKEALERCLELDPDYAAAYHVLGILYREVPGWPVSIGSDSTSLEYLKKAVEYEPDNLDWKVELAITHLEKGQDNEARSLLEEVIAADMPQDGIVEAQNAKEKAQELLDEHF